MYQDKILKLFNAYQCYLQTNGGLNNTNGYDELYKWGIVTQCKGKPDLNSDDFVSEITSWTKEMKNLLFVGMQPTALRHLAEYHPSELKLAISALYDETVPLNKRVATYIDTCDNCWDEEMKQMFGDNTKARADERLASDFLTCHNPQKYTFYKYSVYKCLCEYLEIESKSSKEKLAHFYELINNICLPIYREQKELRVLIDKEVVRADYEVNDLLAIQTALYLLSENQLTINNDNKISTDMETSKYDKYINLLKANHNIVLTGAPGTGKTYMAKEIAKEITKRNSKIRRSTIIDNEGNTSPFENLIMNTLKPGLEIDSSTGRTIYTIVKIEDQKVFLKGDSITPKKIPFNGIRKAYNEKLWEGGQHNNLDSYTAALAKYIFCGKGHEYGSVQNVCEPITTDDYRILVQFHPSYDYTDFVEGLRPTKMSSGTITFERKDGIFKEFCKRAIASKDDIFVFIIDEINRGEISKIFGELFFSIDPGYRGVDGRVKTQYQNLIKDETDPFFEGFYVPDNVYIIGTMNDIDRSVESMDFAMRRRFTWVEVTAEDSMDNIGIDGEKREMMTRLNNAIRYIEGLGKDYELGGAYFLGDMSKEERWEYKIEGLLREYLRGVSNADEKMNALKKAYDGGKDNNEVDAD